jgi:hypothetical protein
MNFNLQTLERMQVLIDTQFKPSAYLYNLLGSEITLANDEIDFAQVTKNQTVAPYVHPCQQGQPVYSEGGSVRRYKLPYVKMRDALTPCDIFNKNQLINGQAYKQTLSGNDAERLSNGILTVLAAQATALQIVNEIQMVSFLTDGAINTQSPWSNGEFIDFGRAATLKTASLAPAQYFDTASSSVMDAIQYAMDLLQGFGYVLSDIVLPANVFSIFKKHQEVASYRKEFRDWNMPNPLPEVINGVKVIDFDGLRIHAYNEFYTKQDPATGAQNPIKFLNSKKAIFIGKRTDGVPIVKAWGKIKNMDAIEQNRLASRIYTNNYSHEGQKIILTEAAPLVVGDPNCAFSMQVIA